MGNETEIPHKVGQLAEERSFLTGYRGAWFRCKIMQVEKCTDGARRLLLKYYDFDDDTPEWSKLYKIPPWKSKYKELMLRPQYPPIYNANKMPHASEISQVSVIVDDSWKVGDLVDWYTTGSFWCGTITKLFGDARAELQLPKQPHGEDLVYEIELKDVRPSLDWSPEHGWTMPKPTQEGKSGRPSAWLLRPMNRDSGRLQIMDTPNLGEEAEAGKNLVEEAEAGKNLGEEAEAGKNLGEEAEAGKNLGEETEAGKNLGEETEAGKNLGKETEASKNSGEETEARKNLGEETEAGKGATASISEEVKSSLKRDGAHLGSTSSENDIPIRRSTLRCEESDTLEAAIMDLEDALNKVKWLEKFLRRSMSSSKAPENEWEFVEPRSPPGNAPS